LLVPVSSLADLLRSQLAPSILSRRAGLFSSTPLASTFLRNCAQILTKLPETRAFFRAFCGGSQSPYISWLSMRET
jgi:hypothetical protein